MSKFFKIMFLKNMAESPLILNLLAIYDCIIIVSHANFVLYFSSLTPWIIVNIVVRECTRWRKWWLTVLYCTKHASNVLIVTEF